MNKADLILALKEGAKLTKPEAAAVVNQFFNEMADALAAGDRVEIRGLCTFYVKQYKAYTGRNPKTGEQVQEATVFQVWKGTEGSGGFIRRLKL